ncbi:MAG: Mth938-like domain-containing protein [Pseudomonadota bacterium]
MRLNEVSYSDALPVDGYGPGFFRIAGTAHEAPLAVLPSGVAPWGGLDDAAPLLAAAGTIDVLLFGMGADIAHLPPALRDALEAAGIGAEVMSSPQACRTYNVLLGEGRRVGLAVLSV